MLDRAVAEMSSIDEPWHSVAREPHGGCYCKGKIILHVVDMLTYPRPVRKFEARIIGNLRHYKKFGARIEGKIETRMILVGKIEARILGNLRQEL